MSSDIYLATVVVKGPSKNYVTLILVIFDPPPYVKRRNLSVLSPPLYYVVNCGVHPVRDLIAV